MDIGQHFRIIWRRRVPILLLSLVIAALVYLWSSDQPKVYQASSQISVSVVASGPNVPSETGLRTRTYAQLVTSTPVLETAIDEAALSLNVNQLRRRLTVGSSEDVPLITITSRGNTPKQSIAINKAVGDATVAKVVADQQAELADDLETIEAEIARQNTIVANTTGPERRLGTRRPHRPVREASRPADGGPRSARGAGRPVRPRQPDQPEAEPRHAARLRAGGDRELRAGRRADGARGPVLE